MITYQAIESAINRLISAGLWIQKQSIQWEFNNDYDEGVLFNGAVNDPQTSKLDPDWFSIWYEDQGSKYFAIIPIGQGNIRIKSSNNLDQIVDAIINYFQMRNVLPKLDGLLWASITDHVNGIIKGFHWLHKAGGSPEIMNASLIHVTFPQRVYSLSADLASGELQVSLSNDNNSLSNPSTFENSIFTILVNEIKLNQEAK